MIISHEWRCSDGLKISSSYHAFVLYDSSIQAQNYKTVLFVKQEWPYENFPISRSLTAASQRCHSCINGIEWMTVYLVESFSCRRFSLRCLTASLLSPLCSAMLAFELTSSEGTLFTLLRDPSLLQGKYVVLRTQGVPLPGRNVSESNQRECCLRNHV